MPGVSQGSYNHDNKLIIGPSYTVMDLLKQFKLQQTRSSQVCQLIIGSEKIAFTIIKQIKGMLVGSSASNKTDCCFELDRVGFWPSFALTKYFSSWRIKIMLALIVT